MVEASTGKSAHRYRWLVFSLLAGAYLLVYFHRLSPAVVAVDMMKDLAAGGTLIGLLSSAYFYPYAFMQLPAGLLSDSWGPRRTVTVFFLLAGAASIFLGFSSSVGMAVAARVLVGLGVSMLFVPTIKILTNWFRPGEFSGMTGILMAVGGLGALTAASPLAWFSAVLGWRGSFIAIGAANLVLSAAIWFCVRNRPEELGYEPVVARPANGTPDMEKIPVARGMKIVLAEKSFWFLAVWFFFTCAVFFSFGGLWGGPYLMHVYGLTKAEAGRILSMLAVAMIFGSPWLSRLSERTLKSRKLLLIGSSALLVALTGTISAIPGGLPVWTLYIFCLLLSLSSSAIVVIGFTMAKELFPISIAGTSVGLVNFFPFLGGAIMQPLIGWVLERQGPPGGPYPPEAYGRAFLLLLGASVIALVAAFLTRETFKKA